MASDETLSAAESAARASACTLADEPLRRRLEMIRDEILPHVRPSEALREGIAWECDDEPEIRGKLERLVELERECCSGLDFDLRTRGGALRLEVRGIDPKGGVFALLGARAPVETGAGGPAGRSGSRDR